MIRIGWFTPVSTQTGIAAYSRNVLEAIKAQYPADQVDVVVFHPETKLATVPMPYPTIELSESLLRSDFHALFDIAVYHLGNNALNHAPIYAAALRHPGVVVLHDYVYQHYLAGVSLQNDFVGPSFGSLVQASGGDPAFEFLSASGILKCDLGAVSFVPWEGEWATSAPMCEILGSLGLGVVVHSAYAADGLGDIADEDVLQLYMPRPAGSEAPAPLTMQSGRTHIVVGGHIGPTKGLRLLLAAFVLKPALRDRYKVTIAGYGSDEEFLRLFRKEIADSGLTGVFDLRVDPTDAEFRGVMASADLFLNLRFPNTEGSSLSLVEQLSFGRPVICYRSGSFAETPADACYFLSDVGDSGELARLLDQIARNPSDIAARGARAWEAVRGRTAAAYGQSLVGFLEGRAQTFARRGALVTARAEGRLPGTEKADRAWFASYTAAKRQLTELAEERHFLPENLFDSREEELGRFVTLNLLHSRTPRENMRYIGRLLKRMPVLEAGELLGQLLVLSEKSVRGKLYLPSHMEALFLPITDAPFWQLLAQLNAQQSVPLAYLALGRDGAPEEIASMILVADRMGLREVFSEFLRARDGNVRRSELAEIEAILSDLDVAAHGEISPASLGADVIGPLVTPEGRSACVLTGFHTPEPNGVWSHSPDAAITLTTGPGSRVKRVKGSAMLFHEGVRKREQLVLNIIEQASGRSTRHEISYDPGEPPVLTWDVPVPGFEGLLRIDVNTSCVMSPFTEGISEDRRNLGVMIKSLVLQD